MISIPVVLLSLVLFLAMVLNLTLKPEFSVQLTKWCILFAITAGILFYGVGYSQAGGDWFSTVIRTVISVIGMFLGKQDASGLSGTTMLASTFGVDLFWLSHLAAFYATASACMITIGSELLRKLRLLLSSRGDLAIIYGINEDSRAIGSACASGKHAAVLFAAESADPGIVREINSAGMAVITAASPEDTVERILRGVRLKKRSISVFAMDQQKEKDLSFARCLMRALEQKSIRPERTSLTLEGDEEMLSSMFLVSNDHYGYGYVHAYDEQIVTARNMIRLCPPWEALSFSAEGRALEDYDCAVIGFGRHGQAALMELIRNGQFVGSVFHAAVFAPDYQRQLGKISTLMPGVLENYDVQFFASDARSVAFYDHLRQRKALKLIAVCTGNDALNREIADDVSLFLSRQGMQVPILLCGKNAVRFQRLPGGEAAQRSAVSALPISVEAIDRSAILLNAYYDTKHSGSAWEKWVSCSTFDKLSSRAAADFLPAFIAASHTTREEILRGDWRPSPALLDSLAESEHLRWCAFHYTNGYQPMSEAEFEANAKEYARCRAAGVECPIRVSKNPVARTHACLIPWDRLDALSQRESALTGEAVDYKQNDINNVLALPVILRAEDTEPLR